MITAPGVYTMSMAEYLADPCPEPSLNASIAHLLLSQSPAHARRAHPRLGTMPREHSDAFDLGTAVHSLVLEGEVAFLEVRAKDWKKKAAKDERAAARAAGLIPLLTAQLEQVRAMAGGIRVWCEGFEPPRPLAEPGAAEAVCIWKEGPLWCRARLDWLHADQRTIDDLKTTGERAHPGDFVRRLFDRGYDLQAAFHTRGVQVLFGTRPHFRFLVAETDFPHHVSLIGLDPEALEFADTRRCLALDRWGGCLRTGQWPAYPTREATVSLPPWIHARFIENRYYEAQLEAP